MSRQFLLKAFAVLACLFMLSASTILAQDLCDSYHDKYRVCVEARDAGSNVDYDDCATYTNETDCNNAGCYWNTEGLPAPGVCTVDICLADTDFSGRITGGDLTPLKKELGRMDCPKTPTNPGYLAAPVPKTGQTTAYATGDDGDLERGVAWPNPRFTDNLDGTVTDNLTGLIWLKDANCFGTRTWWDNALSDSNGLEDGECGLTDGSGAGEWRLPNRFELESLLDLKYVIPALSDTAGTGQWLQGDPFNNVQSHFYWSSTTSASNSIYVWLVNMGNGNVVSGIKSSSYYVWPVRGGQ